jgi:hypothetical protein
MTEKHNFKLRFSVIQLLGGEQCDTSPPSLKKIRY